MAAQDNPPETGFHLDFSLGRAATTYQNEARNKSEHCNSFNATSSSVLPLQQQTPSIFNAKHLSNNATSHNPMSLRTRESSALAVKHIFDQIRQISSHNNNNGSAAVNSSTAGAAAPDQESSQQQEFTGRGLQGLRNQSMPDLRSKHLPELDLSFRQQHFSSIFQAPSSQSVLETGFGSPISTPRYSSSQQQQHPEEEQPQQYSTAVRTHQWPPLMHQRPAAMASSPSTPANQSNNAVPTAQLTIFYSGTVNVYDDVPANRAHAIMLLAGTGNSWSSNSGSRSTVEKLERGCVNPAAASNNISSVNLTLPPALPPPAPSASPSPSPAPPAPSLSTLRSSSPCPSPSPAAAAPTTASVVPTTPYNKASAPSPVAPPSIPSSPIPQTAVKRPHAGIELPHARKASLARFLEKRKDRVQVVAAKQVNNEENSDDAKDQPDQESHNKKQCVDPKPCSERSGFPPCPATGAAMNPKNNGGNNNNDNDNNTEMMLQQQQQQHHYHLHHRPLFDRKIEHRFMD